MRRLLDKKRPSLVETTSAIVIEENPDKIDVLNTYIVHYW